jgi:opacity protein-like surface antigen
MLEFKTGMNIGGTYTTVETPSFKSDTKPYGTGYEFTAELIHEPIPNLITGLGAGYQRSSEMKIQGGGAYSIIDTIPLYITVKYKFNKEGRYMPYIKINFGASLPYTRADLDRTGVEVETGYYGAIGGGVEYNHFILDLSYQWNKNKFDGDYSGEIEFSRLTLGIGYRLGI